MEEVTATDEPLELTDEQVESLYGSGMDVDNMSNDELSQLLQKDKAEEEPPPDETDGETATETDDMEESTDGEAGEQTQTEETETEQEADTTVAEPPQEPEIPEQYKKMIEAEREKYNNLRTLNDRQTSELGQLRQQAQTLQQLQPFVNAMQTNPAFNQHVLGFFNQQGQSQAPAAQQQGQPEIPEPDWTDPAQIREYVQKNAQAAAVRTLQEERQRQAESARQAQQRSVLQRVQTGLNTGKQKLLASGVPEDAVNKAMASLNDAIASGNIVEMAHKIATLDQTIKAEREAAIKEYREKLNKKPKPPPRTAAAAGPKQTKSPDTKPLSLSDITTPEEMHEYMSTLIPGSPEWDQALEFADNKLSGR